MIGGIPLSATPTLMHKSGGSNNQPESKRKKLKRYESRQKDLETGMQNWVNTQGDYKHK